MNALELLQAHPRRFSMLASLRIIERAHSDKPRLGMSASLREDPVRVVQFPHLSFAPCEVEDFDAEAPVPQLSQYAFGLLGPAGPLPLHLTEYALERRQRDHDTTFVEFLSALQHRVLTLQYRTWTVSDAAASADRPSDDAFGAQLASLLGLAEGEDIGSHTPARSLIGEAGLLVNQSRPPEALAALLQDWLGVRVEVHEFCGEWLPIPQEQRTVLGRSWSALGEDAALGGESWQGAHRFELVAGPLSLEELERLLPGTTRAQCLTELVTHYTHRQWSWRLRLRLRAGEADPVTLGRNGQLGWTSWLGVQAQEVIDVELEGDPVVTTTVHPR